MTTKLAKDIRAEAWNALGEKGQYWTFAVGELVLAIAVTVPIVLLCIVAAVVFIASGAAPYFQQGGHPDIGLFTDPAIMLPILSFALVASIVIIYPIGFMAWGNAAMSIATMRKGLKFGHAFSGWGHGWKMGWIVMVKYTYITLWTLLFWIPGIVKALSYAMTEFIAVDHPDWNATQCITESRRMMDGHKWRFFCLMVSFIGWFVLLIFFTLVSAFVLPMAANLLKYFFMPYIESAKAAFYEDLLDRADAVKGTGSGEVTDYVDMIDRNAVV